MSSESERVPATGRVELQAALQAATIGQFEILDELGSGGMATVFLAHDISLDRPVAVKVMLPALGMADGMVERFRREARTVASLSHPHIIPIYAVGEVGQLIYFVMKYVAGRPLDQIVHEFGPMDFDMVEAILGQVGGALAYGHRRGVIHRDIKPANIMLDEDGWAVVTDFGIAKTVEPSGLTSTGASVGTPYYMSPEQYRGIAVTSQSDQYSLGVVAFELLAGKLPFAGRSFADLVQVHAFDGLPPITQFRPDCPEPLARVVMRMVSKEATDRFESIDQAVAELKPRPSASDDPVRTQMVTLARSGKRVIVPRPPTSPIPRNRISAAARTIAAQGPQARPAHPVRRGFLIALGLAVVAAGGGAVSRLFWAPPTGTLSEKAQSAPLPETLQPATPPVVPPQHAESSTTAPIQRAAQTPPGPSQGLRTNSRTENRFAPAAKDTATVAAPAPLPPPAPPIPNNGWVRLGTRAENAVVYINGVPQLPKSPSLRWWRVPIGAVRLAVSGDGCKSWEQTIQVTPGDSVTIGNRYPRCGVDSTASARDSAGGRQ